MGHHISHMGVTTNLAKIDAIQQWVGPTTIKQLRGFLGLSRYYLRFITNFAQISQPLNMLLKGTSKFVWTDTTQTAFETLKQALTSTLVLALLNFNQDFVIETNVTRIGILLVLLRNGHPIVYISKMLSKRH